MEESRENPKPRTSMLTKLDIRIGVVLKAVIALGALLLFLDGNYQATFESLVILFLTFLPLLMDRHFQVRIPHEFESLAILFIYASLFLGEVQEYYVRFWWWDLVLHAGSSFLLGIVGFLLVYVLNQNQRINLHLTPGFIAFFAFNFALALGVVWEIFEFAMDGLFGLNMQKSGLVDTMWDLILNTGGALVIAILGYGYLKTEVIDSFLERWIERFITINPRIFHRRK